MLWGNKVLPDNLKGQNHADYVWPMSLIPRAWTSFWVMWQPKKLAGNQRIRWIYTNTGSYWGIDPIPARGYWSIQGVKLADWLPYLPLYFTMTTKNGGHFSIGVRYDSVDDYYQVFRFAFYMKNKY